MQPKLRLNDREHIVEPLRFGDAVRISIDGHTVEVDMTVSDAHHGSIVVDGIELPFVVAQDERTMYLHLAGRHWEVEIVDEFSGAGAGGAASDGAITAPMPGVVLEVMVAEGDQVTVDQPVALIESMKMQTELVAPVAGTVTAVHVEAGQSFEKASPLVEVVAEED